MLTFNFHIGDWCKKTMHLTDLERSVYLSLLLRYYDTEQPLPTDERAVCRIACARNADAMQAVSDVLEEFFTLQDDGWHNSRADEEIAQFRCKSEKARASADARWKKRNADEQKPDSEGNADAMRTHSEGNANHEPRTTNHEPPQEHVCAAPVPDAAPPDEIAIHLTLNTGDEHPITVPQALEFQRLYQGVNVPQELAKMRGWLISNPAKRKTKRGIMAFVNNWLSKQQDSGGSSNGNAGHQNAHQSGGRKLSLVERQAIIMQQREAERQRQAAAEFGAAGQTLDEDDRDVRPPLDGESWRVPG